MECRPSLLMIVVALAGAASAKWAMQSSVISIDEPTAPQELDTSRYLQQTAQLELSEKSRKTPLHPTQLDPAKHSDLHSRESQSIDEGYADSSNDAKAPINLVELLAEQGIILTGIESNSSHADLLFTMFFLQPGTDKDHAIEIILGDWSKAQPAQAWQWIQSNDSTGALHRYRATILQHWLPVNANDALLAITSLPPSDDKNSMLADYAAFIAIEEPDRAFYWAYGLTNKTTRQLVLDSVVYQWASSDPEQVILHLENILEPDIKQQLLFQAGPTITSQLTQTNPHRAMMWTSSLNKYENEFLSPIAFQQWVNKTPDEAMGWLLAQNSSETNELFMANAASTLAYQNLPVAVEYFPSMSKTVQENMASSIAFSMYQIDPNEAKNWSNNIPASKVQQNANRGILLASVNNEPEFALQMALNLVGQDQNEVLTTTAVEVDQQHPDLLENWLSNAAISESQLQDIRTALVPLPTD